MQHPVIRSDFFPTGSNRNFGWNAMFLIGSSQAGFTRIRKRDGFQILYTIPKSSPQSCVKYYTMFYRSL
ncbi:hypothetical protein, partial [Facklamia hominis]|uniref:hypothetical protein n=1 Tax=Facklamia hominis TaxID=178214 RepID=UPI00288B29C6